MKKSINKIIFAIIIFLFAFIIKFENNNINKLLYLISYLIVGYKVLQDALKNILKCEIFDENFLMTIATIGAFFIGEFPEAVCVMLLYQIGEIFQDYAVDKSEKSIEELMNIRADFANVIRNGKEEKVNPNDVKIGEIILIKPGEKIPLDGKVIEGVSKVDTKALTGESIPKNAQKNSFVCAGFINQTGVIKIKVEKEFSESSVSKILDLVKNASSKKSNPEKFITKFSKVYTPTIVILALILAISPPLFIKGQLWLKWINRALSFLVVSCPCALVISIPLSFFSSIGGASKQGILIKGSNYIEILSKTKVAVFDKTGTLTKGVFKVQEINAENIDEQELLKIAALAESFSSHLIASSIKEAYKEEIDNSKIKNFEEINGLGISANIEGKNVLLGSEKLLEKNNIKYEKCNKVGTIVYVAIDSIYMGYILISDKIKDEAKQLIKNFKSVEVIMLTGDKKKVAEDVGRKLEIEQIYSELLPEDKVEKVEELIEKNSKNEKLIFVGDGINDAPVLAVSDVGIAMGGIGTDAAIEAADVVIMDDNPYKILKLINLSKKTMFVAKQNIVFAILVKFVVLVLSAFGISNLWEAVFADVGVSIIAIINSLRCLKVK